MTEANDQVQLGPTWGLRLIGSMEMRGYEHDLLTEAELISLKSHTGKAASAYEIVLGNYCVQKVRADVSEKEVERLTTENADLKSKIERESNEELTRKIAELAVLCVDSQREIVRLKRRVNKLLDARLNGSVVFIPAEGESHGKLN